MNTYWTVVNQKFLDRVFGHFYGKCIIVEIRNEIPIVDEEDEKEEMIRIFEHPLFPSPFELRNLRRRGREIECAPTLIVRALRFLFRARACSSVG